MTRRQPEIAGFVPQYIGALRRYYGDSPADNQSWKYEDGLHSRALRSYLVDPITGCWIWQLQLDRQGYGRIKNKSGSKLAHRVVFELLNGPISKDLVIDHLCRRKACVNPAHPEPVTFSENVRRGSRLIQICRQGQEYTEENTYFRPNGRRDCRACVRERARSYKQRLSPRGQA